MENLVAEEKVEARIEYWRWPEGRWTSPDIDWRAGQTISAGVDVGSVSSKAAIMVDGKLYAYAIVRTGSNSPESASKVMAEAQSGTGMTLDDIHYCVGTGYGRVKVPMAQRAITEIACHALGAHYVFGPTVRTVLDVGGQDCKVIQCDEKGKVVTFLMNDKCAAGTGRGMEVFADLMAVPIQDIGERSLQVDKDPPPVNALCVVFAKTEAVALLREGHSADTVIAAYCRAMAIRIHELISRVGVEKDICITGGQSKNIGVVRRVEQLLGFPTLQRGEVDPQIAGAIGAARFAAALIEKSRRG